MGKWHMGEDNDLPRPGFDFFATHKGQGKYFDTEWNLNGAGTKAIPGYYTTVVTDLALDWIDSSIRVATGSRGIHYLIADRTGRAVTIEHLGGALVTHSGATLPVTARDSHSSAS